MPHMTALTEFSYAAGALQLKPGDKFFALSERDAQWLTVWGKAKEVDEKGTQISDDALHAAVMEPEEPAPVRTKRKYTRRDISYWSK